MRISGQVIGARVTTATRRSVIFRSDGREWVLVFCTAASSVSPPQMAAPMPAADRRKLRRAVNIVVVVFMCAILRDILFTCEGEISESWCFYGATGADAAGRRDYETEGNGHRYRGARDRQLSGRSALQAVDAGGQGGAQRFQAEAGRQRN